MRSRPRRDDVRSRAGLGRRSLRFRLVLFVCVTLTVVCGAMALSTVVVQRVYLYEDLDWRVTDAAERSQGGLQRRAGGATDWASSTSGDSLRVRSRPGSPAGGSAPPKR